jgi:hypothetical protein
VDERRRVDQLDGDATAERSLAIVGSEVHEQRTQTLPAGVERLERNDGDQAGLAGRCCAQTLLELVEVRTGREQDLLRAHACSAVCSATMPPARSR